MCSSDILLPQCHLPLANIPLQFVCWSNIFSPPHFSQHEFVCNTTADLAVSGHCSQQVTRTREAGLVVRRCCTAGLIAIETEP